MVLPLLIRITAMAATHSDLLSPTELNGWLKTGSVIAGPRAKPLIGEDANAAVIAKCGPLHILYIATALRTKPGGAEAQLRVRCLDGKGRVVMEQSAPADPAKERSTPGVYFKTHAFTSKIEVSVIKTGPAGQVDIESVELRDDDFGRVPVPPKVDLDQAMRPIWKPGTAYNETVLLRKDESGQVSGNLLFAPTKIISVRSYGLDQSFEEARDFVIEGQTIRSASGAKLPFVTDNDFEKGDLKWFDLQKKHILVTYEHSDAWAGPVPTSQVEQFPNAVRKLKSKKRLTIAATGDSITLGIGTSAYTKLSPYMLTWPELVSDALSKHYAAPKPSLYNVALGGMTSDWGAENAMSAVASLKPDLVLVAYGMNDFWWMPADRYRDNIAKIMRDVRSKNSKAEFILIAPMQFDPLYAQAAEYPARLKSYAPALRSLEALGVRVLDMTAITEALYAAKGAKDFIGDPLHPNDFLARWYAQGVVALLTP